MRNLSNITIAELRQVLSALGLEKQRTKGGHEAWRKEGMTRLVVFQTHIEPIPEFIVKNAIRNLGVTRQEFLEILEKL